MRLHSILALAIMDTLLLSPFHLKPPVHVLSLCSEYCGNILVKYPFSLSGGCGSSYLSGLLTCNTNTANATELLLQISSGSYPVSSIDYDKKTLDIFDVNTSTCSILKPRHEFSISDVEERNLYPSADSVVALLNCSATSPLFTSYTKLCHNFTGLSCENLYGCSSFEVLSPDNSTKPPCCFTDFATLKFMSMKLLECTHLTTFYDLKSLSGVTPADWKYGVKLSFAVPDVGCVDCERSDGICGYDTETMGHICMCGGGIRNESFNCGKERPVCPDSATGENCGSGGGADTGGGRRLTPVATLGAFMLAFGAVLGNIIL